MKEQIEVQITINVPVEVIWKVLSDFKSYPQWSPTIAEFYGEPQVGKRTKVLLTQPGGTGIKMNPIFLKIAENKELRWKGSLFVKGLFDGEHYFLIKRISQNQSQLIQGECFSGLLIPFFKKMIHGNTKKGFELFNKALKERVESGL